MALYVRDKHGVLHAQKIPAYKGEKGEVGVTPNIQIGDVVTLEAGQQATVVRKGTDENPVFDFSIPKGETGSDGIFVGSIDDAPDHAQVVVNDDPTPYDLFFENANVDYMGNTYTSLKEKADADIEYLLRKFGTQHYEGTNVTATDTYMKRVNSAMFKGQTLVNLIVDKSDYENRSGDININILGNTVTANTNYTLLFDIDGDTTSTFAYGFLKGSQWLNGYFTTNVGKSKILINTSNATIDDTIKLRLRTGQSVVSKLVLVEGDYTNQDIPYFEGMQSTKSPVLTTIGENLIGECINPTERRKKYKAHLKPNTRYTLNYRYSNGGNTSSGGVWLLNGNTELAFFGYSHTMRFTTPSNISDTTVLCIDSWNNDISVLLVEGDNYYNASLEDILKRPYKVPSTLTTPSDLILCGVGDVYDTLDLLTGEVVQRVEYTEHLLQDVFNFSNGFGRGIIYNEETDRWIGAHNGINQSYFNNMLPLNFSITDNKNSNVSIYKVNGDWFGFSVKSSELIAKGYEATANGLFNYAKNEKMKCFYKLATPIKKPSIDLKGQKVYSYDGTTHYTCTSADGHPAPILSIDVPTNTTTMIARQRETIEHQEQKLLEQEEVQNILIESQLAWYEQTLLPTLDLPNKKQLPTHIQKLYEVAYKRGIRTRGEEL